MSEPMQLPMGWIETTLGDVANLIRGISYPKEAATEKPQYGYLPILRATNIQDEHLALDTDLVYVPSDLVNDDQLLQLEDVVVCMSSGSKHLVGKSAQLLMGWHGSFGAFCAAIRFSQILDRRFCGYYLSSPGYRSFIREKSSGININNLRRSDMSELKISLPPLAEQQRIVAAIEQQFTRLDAGIASLRQAQARLKRYRAAVLKAAVEGHLTEAWRAAHPDAESAAALLARILAERRARWEDEQRAKGKDPAKLRYDEPAGPDTTGLPALPKGWVWASVEQLASNDEHALAIGPFGSNLKVEDYRTDGIPLIFVRNIRTTVFDGPSTRYISKEKAQELRPHMVNGGDILITKMGDPPGDACLYPEFCPPAIITADCIKWALSEHLTSSLFFVNAINSILVKHQILSITKGVAQLKVSLGRFKTVAFPLPSLEEQEQIVAEVERRLSVVSEVEAEVAANLKRAERLRQSILREAFAGRLVAQDSAEEPASALLARIQAERAGREGSGGRRRKGDVAEQAPAPTRRPDVEAARVPTDARQLTLLAE